MHQHRNRDRKKIIRGRAKKYIPYQIAVGNIEKNIAPPVTLLIISGGF